MVFLAHIGCVEIIVHNVDVSKVLDEFRETEASQTKVFQTIPHYMFPMPISKTRYDKASFVGICPADHDAYELAILQYVFDDRLADFGCDREESWDLLG